MTVCLGGGRERHSGRYDAAAEGAGPIGNGRSREHHRPGVDREDRAGFIPGDGRTVRTRPNDVHLGSRGIQRAQRAAQRDGAGRAQLEGDVPCAARVGLRDRCLAKRLSMMTT